MRVVALLLLLAVLPTVELGEQLVHVVTHLAHGEAPSHSAHHDEAPGDEHGCTALVHLCAGQVLPIVLAAPRTQVRVETLAVIAPAIPTPLTDKFALAPPHRPPIG